MSSARRSSCCSPRETPTRRRRCWPPPPAPKKTRWTTSSCRPASTSCPRRRSTPTRRSSSWLAGVSATPASTACVASCSTAPRRSPQRSGDAVLYRSAGAELAKVRQLAALDYAGAEAAAREVLASAGPDEQLTRARANEFLGFALCRRVDSDGRRDERAVAEAEECFARASQLYLGLGRRAAASFVLVDWTVHIDFPTWPVQPGHGPPGTGPSPGGGQA